MKKGVRKHDQYSPVYSTLKKEKPNSLVRSGFFVSFVTRSRWAKVSDALLQSWKQKKLCALSSPAMLKGKFHAETAQRLMGLIMLNSKLLILGNKTV